MKIRSLKFAIAAICIVFFALILKSCKKVDNSSLGLNTSAPTTEQLTALKDSIALHPELASVVIPINDTIPMNFYTKEGKPIYDAKGNMIEYGDKHQEWVYTCGPTPTHGNYVATLPSVIQNYNCSQGYSYTVTWVISSPVNIVNVSPLASTLVSQGQVKVTNIASQVTYQNLTLPVTITALSSDPNDTYNINRLFQVVYTTPFIPFSDFSPSQAATIQFNVSLYSDCIYFFNLNPANFSSPTNISIGGLTSNPCNRIDPIFFAPSSSNTNQMIGFLGFGNGVSVSGCPSPPNGNYSDRQEIELAYAGTSLSTLTPVTSSSLNWHDIRFQTTSKNSLGYNTGTVAQQGTIGVFDYYGVPSWDLYSGTTAPAINVTSPPTAVHGYYYVQYRDWMAAGCRGSW